VYVQR